MYQPDRGKLLFTGDHGRRLCIILGCTDSTKIGYVAAANTDDGSCIEPAYICTDPLAANTVAPGFGLVSDPSTCIYPGCTDSRASNFDPSANADDSSCIYTRASATIASFGYMSQCFVFVDENSNRLHEQSEPYGISGSVGYFSIIYQLPGTVVVNPSRAGASCSD